jgi:hypothetical protein
MRELWSPNFDVVDVVYDAAEAIRESGRPVRWFLVRGDRIVMETAHPAPHWWFRPSFPHRDDGFEEVTTARLAEQLPEWGTALYAWREAPVRYLTAFLTPAGPDSTLYVDVASVDDELLAWMCSRFRDDGDVPITRTRDEMLDASPRHAAALAAWEWGDDAVLADDVTWWADQVLNVETRNEAKMHLLWGGPN